MEEVVVVVGAGSLAHLAVPVLTAEMAPVRDLPWLIAVVTAFAAYFFVFVVFPRYSYELTDSAVKMKWAILGRVTLSTWEISLSDISAARRCFLWVPPFAYTYGRALSANGVLLLLKRRIRLRKSVYITPEHPERFVANISHLLRDRPSEVSGELH